MSTNFKEKFRQFGTDIEQLRDGVSEIRNRLTSIEQSGGGGGGSGGDGTSDTIDVTDYGATGNGSSDDGPAIQDALIDAAAAGGRSVVRFPDGTYFVEGGPVLIPSNVTLRGAGMGNSVIKGALNNEATLEFDKFDREVCQNVELTGLTFTKDAKPDNTDSWYFFGTVDNVRFHHCEWRDLPRQAGLFRGSDYKITNCRIRNTGRDGFLFVGVDRPIVANNHFFRTGDDSIAFNTDTNNGVAVGNVIVESGFHHAGGGVKQHGNNCVVSGNVFVRPKTYAIRIQNPDEISSSESPWPDRDIFANNVVNGMSSVGGSNNYAIAAQALNGDTLISGNVINTETDDGENRRGMRIRGTGPLSRVHIKDCTVRNSPNANSKYGIVVEEEVDRLEISGCSFYDTSDMVYKRTASEAAGDCEIRDNYFDPGEAKRLFNCQDDDGFETLRVRGNTSQSPSSVLVNCGEAKFGLVQVYDNLAREQSLTAGTGGVEELVTGPL